MPDFAEAIQSALSGRFGERLEVDPALPGLEELLRLASRRVQRRYLARDIEPGVLRMLCACALSAPSKSDLPSRNAPTSAPLCVAKDSIWIEPSPSRAARETASRIIAW
jgi:hypothetical protein